MCARNPVGVTVPASTQIGLLNRNRSPGGRVTNGCARAHRTRGFGHALGIVEDVLDGVDAGCGLAAHSTEDQYQQKDGRVIGHALMSLAPMLQTNTLYALTFENQMCTCLKRGADTLWSR